MVNATASISPLFWSITELLEAYSSKRLSPVEVLEEALTRMDRYNDELNAYIGRFDDLAREQARQAEAAWYKNDALLLSGIPVSIKDTFHIAGQIASYGSLAYKDNRRAQNSGVVRRLREAGTVFTGRTNTAEFAQSATAENAIFDDSHNPWDTTRTTGGSSGGAAASVAAGLCTVGIGADGGGSIRIPAALTGLFGFKPTHGVCRDEGGLNVMSDFVAPGPLSRCVADARYIYQALRSDDNHRPSGINDGRSLRVGFCLTPRGCPHDDRLLQKLEPARQLLEKLGHYVHDLEIDLAGWREAFDTLVLFNEYRERGHLLDTQKDLLTGYARRSLEVGKTLKAEQIESAHRHHLSYRNRIRDLFTGIDALVLPATATTAFTIGLRPTIIDEVPVHWLWGAFPCTAPFNVAGTPAANLPFDMLDGLPVGLQLVSPMGTDELILDLAQQLELEHPFDYTPMHKQWS